MRTEKKSGKVECFLSSASCVNCARAPRVAETRERERFHCRWWGGGGGGRRVERWREGGEAPPPSILCATFQEYKEEERKGRKEGKGRNGN